MVKVAKGVSLPPAGQNRLSAALGKKISAVMRARGLSLEEAAEKLGLDVGHLFYIKTGRAIPNEAVCNRLLAWIRGADFTGQRLKASVPLDPGWPLVKTKIPGELLETLRREAKRQGVSQATLIHIAIERLLANRPFLATMKEAKKLVEEQRELQALREVPSLKSVLEFDVKLARRAESGVSQPASKVTVESVVAEPVLDVAEDFNKWSEV